MKDTQKQVTTAAANTAVAVEKKADVYVVAPKKSLTSKKGIIGEGCVVIAEYFSGGEKTFADLIANGSVVKQ